MIDNYENLTRNPYIGYYRECAREYRGTEGMAQKIIDCHCHIFPDGIAPKAVHAIDHFYGEVLPPQNNTGTAAELLQTGLSENISHFIVYSVATTPAQVTSINHFIRQSIDKCGSSVFTGMGTMHPDSPDSQKDFEEIRALGLFGVKLHPDIQHFYADDPWAMSVYEMCESSGLPICVHTGDYRYNFSNPARIAGILRRFPKLTFIGAHFGGWSVWGEALRTLADFPNLVVDTSSTFYWTTPDQARELIRGYGSERVMFGTDYPVCQRKTELQYLKNLSLTQEEYEDICWRTCSRVFHLDHKEFGKGRLLK